MSAHLPTQPAAVYDRRRRAFASHLGDTPAVVFSGGLRARNYPANTFPYRADSHFLFLVGAAIPNAALFVWGQRAELFVVPHDPDDALWHGESASNAALAQATGVDHVRPVSELPEAISSAGGREAIGTLPSADPLTRARQSTLLGRSWTHDAAPKPTALGARDLSTLDAMVAARSCHDDAGIETIRTAMKATAAAHIAGMEVTRAGMFEYEIRAAMEYELMRRGLSCAYGSIVTVHGEVLHNTDHHHRLAESDLLLADLGGELDGWATDVTRTWPVRGKFSPTQRALYDIVLQANRDAIALVKPGVRYRDLHIRASVTLAQGLVDEGVLAGDAETLVERGAHALVFPHGVGHLLGLDVHDMEDLGDRAWYAPGRQRSQQFGLNALRLDRDLEPNMVVTIEPGLYLVPAILKSDTIAGPFIADKTFFPDKLERFSDVRGIRIEDDVLCTHTGHEVLSEMIPKAAAEVEELAGRTAK